MSINQIDKIFDKFYASVYKIINDQSANKRYLSRSERLQLEAEKKRKEDDENKIFDFSEFQCEICLEEQKREDGIKLSGCYHIFCK